MQATILPSREAVMILDLQIKHLEKSNKFRETSGCCCFVYNSHSRATFQEKTGVKYSVLPSNHVSVSWKI